MGECIKVAMFLFPAKNLILFNLEAERNENN